jgi:hypothetical protein
VDREPSDAPLPTNATNVKVLRSSASASVLPGTGVNSRNPSEYGFVVTGLSIRTAAAASFDVAQGVHQSTV